MTGKQQVISRIIRIFGILEERYPVSRMEMNVIPPTGNWKRMELRVEYPNVEIMSGPNPVTAPLAVKLQPIQQCIIYAMTMENSRRSHHYSDQPDLHIKESFDHLKSLESSSYSHLSSPQSFYSNNLFCWF